jgi:hypothetical protein
MGEPDKKSQSVLQRALAVFVEYAELFYEIICKNPPFKIVKDGAPKVRNDNPDNAILAKHSMALGKKPPTVLLGEVFQGVGRIDNINRGVAPRERFGEVMDIDSLAPIVIK